MYLSLAMAMNFIAVFWSVILIRLWNRPSNSTRLCNINGALCKKGTSSSKLCDCIIPVEENKVTKDATAMPSVCMWHLGLECVDKVLFWLFVVYLVITVLTLLIIVPCQIKSPADVYKQLNNTYQAVYVI